MKVLLVNGSSLKNGCTNAALCEVEHALNEEGIETEQFFLLETRRCRTALPVANAGRLGAVYSMIL